MKTENELARSNVKVLELLTEERREVLKALCVGHLASCQRFLEFLELNRWAWSEEIVDSMEEKIIDLQNAIKIYKDGGVK